MVLDEMLQSRFCVASLALMQGFIRSLDDIIDFGECVATADPVVGPKIIPSHARGTLRIVRDGITAFILSGVRFG